MLKDYFEVPNKPAIKSGNILSCDFTDHETFIPQPLDYSRGTLATYVDCNGLIKMSGVSDTELVTNGDFATDSDWIKGTGWSIANGKASKVAGSATELTQLSVFPSLSKTFKITFTLDVTAGSVRLRAGTNNQAYLNSSGSYVYYLTPTGNDQLKFNADSSFAGSVDNVSVKEVDVNTARIDYTTEIGKAKELQKPSLLLEPQSTNLIPYSEDFSNSAWTKNNVTVTSGFTSPDGTNNAYLMTDDATDSKHGVYDIDILSQDGNIYTRSVFVKKGTARYVVLSARHIPTSSGTSWIYDFDSNNWVLTGSSGAGQSIKNYANGWVRLSVSHISNSNFNNDFSIGISSGATVSDASYSGSGDTLYIWGAQIEQLSYSTSYIPTSGSTVTRNQDRANNAGQLGVFNSEEGALYVDIAALANAGGDRRITISDGTSNNKLMIYYFGTADRIAFAFYTGGALQLFDAKFITATDYNKIALQWKQNDAKIYINGSLAHTDTSINVPSPGTFTQFEFDDNGGNIFFGKVKEVKAFRRALTDAELTELTNNIV